MVRSLRGMIWLTAGLVGLADGSNDGQKAMGLATALLVAAGTLRSFAVPFWVTAVVAFVLVAGTAAGGRRIVHNVSSRFYRGGLLDGLAAESASAIVILGAASIGAPVTGMDAFNAWSHPGAQDMAEASRAAQHHAYHARRELLAALQAALSTPIDQEGVYTLPKPARPNATRSGSPPWENTENQRHHEFDARQTEVLRRERTMVEQHLEMLAQNTQLTEQLTRLTNEVHEAVCVGAKPGSSSGSLSTPRSASGGPLPIHPQPRILGSGGVRRTADPARSDPLSRRLAPRRRDPRTPRRRYPARACLRRRPDRSAATRASAANNT